MRKYVPHISDSHGTFVQLYLYSILVRIKSLLFMNSLVLDMKKNYSQFVQQVGGNNCPR